MKKHFELVREIFNKCSGNQMRDVFVSEVETEEPDEYVKQFLSGPEASLAKREEASGVIIYDIEACGLRQRLSFTPV